MKKIDWGTVALWVVYALLGPLCLILGIRNMINGGRSFLAVIGLLVTLIPIADKSNKKEQNEESSKRQYIRRVDQSTIRVTACNPINASVLRMKKRLQTSYKHNPAQASYVGATVGGVHMGDWKVEEAYTSSSISGETNKYNLWYDDYNSFGSSKKEKYRTYLISNIEISEEMAKKAKAIPAVNKYLKDNKLVLENPDNSKVRELRQLLQYAHTTADAYNVTSRIGDEKALSQTEMAAVYNFLCGR